MRIAGVGRAAISGMDPESAWLRKEEREHAFDIERTVKNRMKMLEYKVSETEYKVTKYHTFDSKLRSLPWVEQDMKKYMDLVSNFKRGDVILYEMIALMDRLDHCMRCLSDGKPVIVKMSPLFSCNTLPRKLRFYEWIKLSWESISDDVFESLRGMCAVVRNKALSKDSNWAHKVRRLFDKDVAENYGGVKEIRRLPDGNYSSYTECPVCLKELEDHDCVIRPCCGFNACRECADLLRNKSCSLCRSEPSRTKSEVKRRLKELSDRGSEWATCELIKEEDDLRLALKIAEDFAVRNESHRVVDFYMAKLKIDIEGLTSLSHNPEDYSGEHWTLDMLLYTLTKEMNEEASEVFLKRACVSGSSSAGFKVIEGLPAEVRLEMLKALVMSRDLVARRFYGLEIMKTFPDLALAYLLSYKSNLSKLKGYKGEDSEISGIIRISMSLLRELCAECASKTPPLRWCKCKIVRLCHSCHHNGCEEIVKVLEEEGLRTEMMSGRDQDYRSRPSWLKL